MELIEIAYRESGREGTRLEASSAILSGIPETVPLMGAFHFLVVGLGREFMNGL